MSERIGWERTGYGWRSSVGAVDGWPFEIWGAVNAPGAWRLKSDLPGKQKRPLFHDDPDELKAEAEKWLERFVSSLGAVFPEPGFEFEDDGEPLEVKYAPGNRVRFAHPDYGYPGEQAPAAEHLTAGEVYTIAAFQIGQSRTDLILEGIPGEWFNSVFFEPVSDEEAGQ